jgi:hypothetical protein
MARVRSTARLRDDVPAAEVKCATIERAIVDEVHDNIGSAERTKSAHASDAGSQSHVEGDSDGGSHTRIYYFSPLTVVVSRIQKMIDQGYSIEGCPCVGGGNCSRARE